MPRRHICTTEYGVPLPPEQRDPERPPPQWMTVLGGLQVGQSMRTTYAVSTLKNGIVKMCRQAAHHGKRFKVREVSRTMRRVWRVQ